MLYKNIFYSYHNNVKQLKSKLHLVFLFALKCLHFHFSIERKIELSDRERKRAFRQFPRYSFIIENLIETRSVLLGNVPFCKIFPGIMERYSAESSSAEQIAVALCSVRLIKIDRYYLAFRMNK